MQADRQVDKTKGSQISLLRDRRKGRRTEGRKPNERTKGSNWTMKKEGRKTKRTINRMKGQRKETE